MEAVAIVMVLALGFVVAGLRKRIGALENVVMRLQGRIDDLGRHAVPPATTAAPIDIEQFVD